LLLYTFILVNKIIIMKKNVTQLFFAVLLFAFLPKYSKAQWINNTNNFTDASHTPVCIDGSDQIYPITTTSTNDSSYFVAWMDNRNGDWDIYAQKYNSAGVAQWAVNGIPVVTGLKNQKYYLGGVGPSSYETQFYSLMASDNAGGFYIAFQDDSVPGNTTRYRVGVQHVLVNGNVAFGSTGNIVAAPNAFNTTTTCKNPQLIADGHDGFFLAYENIQNGSVSYLTWGSYKDINGILKCFGSDVANRNVRTLFTSSLCGGYVAYLDYITGLVNNYHIWSDNQGGCSIAFTSIANNYGYIGYNKMVRVKKNCVSTRYSGGKLETINYKKDSVFQIYNFSASSNTISCKNIYTQDVIVATSTAVERNGFEHIDNSPSSLTGIYSYVKGANLITKGTSIIGNTNISTDVIAYYKRGIAGNTTLPPVLYTKNFINEVYDSIPYELSGDTSGQFIVKPATLPKMVVKTTVDIGDTAIGQPYNTSISDFTMQTAGNTVFIATKSPTASANAIVLQKLKLLPDAFYTDSFSVKRVTNNKNGVVVATDITSYPTHTYTYPSIAVGKNGSALLCYTENNGFMRVSALSDSCKILWGTNGYALGTGYLNGNLYNAKYPTVTIGSNNKTALVTWQDSYRSGNTGENIYARNIDSLPNNLPECVNGLLPLPNITGASGVCTGQQLQLANAVPTGLWSSSSNSISINAGTGLVNATGAAVGNHTINYVVSGAACSGTVSKTIYVSASPNITASTNAQTGIVTNNVLMCKLGDTISLVNYTAPYGVWASTNTTVANIAAASLNYGRQKFVIAAAEGNAVVSYTLTTPAGCVATANTNVVVSTIAAPAAITGASAVCVGSTIALNNITPNGRWSSVAGLATVNSVTGVVTGSNAGAATIQYSVSNIAGCVAAANKNITVNALPAVPSIAYAIPFTNPQAGAPAGGYCVGKSFGLTGIPNGGVWNTSGSISMVGNIATINTIGAGSIIYTYTNANGCLNSRTMNGTGYTCAARQLGGATIDQNPMANDFVLFPNPAHSVVGLQVDNLIGEGKIIITDLYGKTVKSQPLSMGNNTIDIANLSKGFYLISTITTDGKTTKKLVLE
jgi:Secretion system C-terminal sorting domain